MDGAWRRKAFLHFGINEKSVEVLPEETLGLKKGGLYLNYGTHKTGITDKDVSISSQIHRISKNGSVLYYSPLPVEANDQRASVEDFYRFLAEASKIKPYCELKGAGLFEVTVLPRRFSKQLPLYRFERKLSKSQVQIRDNRFGFKTTLKIPARPGGNGGLGFKGQGTS